MGNKNNRSRHNAKRPTAKNSQQKKGPGNDADVIPTTPDIVKEHKVSPSPGFIKELEAVEITTKGSDPQIFKILKIVAAPLQSFALLAAIIAIPIAYRQGNVQISQGEFEKNQRVVEMAVTLGTYWEERLDPDTRHRARLFIRKLSSLTPENDTPPSEANQLLQRRDEFLLSFLNTDKVDGNSTGNKDLDDLLKPPYNSDNSKGAINPTLELSRYMSALVRLLNTMEMIAIVRKYTKDDEARSVLKYAYESSIKQRYDALEPFIRAYQVHNKAFREVPAWYLLDQMIQELRGSASLVEPRN